MRSLISLDFPAQKWNLKAHMWYQMWRFAMQHHPGNIHQSFATPRYSATPCYVLIQLPNVIDAISNDGGPILGPENLLKTGFAQKGLPSSPQPSGVGRNAVRALEQSSLP